MSPMATPSPDELSKEIAAGVTLRRKYTSAGLRLREMFVGQAWKDSFRGDAQDPIRFNHTYEYIVNMVATLVYSNPIVDCTSDGVNTPASEAEQAGLNSLFADIGLSETLQLMAIDMMCDFAVAAIVLEPTPELSGQVDPLTGSTFQPLRPTVVRIPPSRFVCDAAYMGMGEPLFIGHLQIKHKDELLAETDDEGQPIYDHDEVNQLASADMNEVTRDILAGCDIAPIKRDTVAFWEIFMPRQKMLYTLGMSGKNSFLRPPREYTGSRHGPYIIGGVHPVPDSLYPMAPLAATAALVEELNIAADKFASQVQTAKSFTVIDSAISKSADTIKNCNNGDLIQVTGFVKGMLEQVTIGGPDPVTAQYIADLLQRLDRTSGIGDVIRGASTNGGSKTATEVATADKHADIRTKAITSRFKSFVIECISRMAELMHESPHVCFPVTTDDDSGKKVAKMFLGGPLPGEENVAQPIITIEPYSMEYVPAGLQQKRVQDAMNLIMGVAPAIPTMPYVKWRNLLDDAFRASSVPNGANRYIDFDALAQQIGLAATQPTNPGDDNGADQQAPAASPIPLPSPLGGPGQSVASNSTRQQTLARNTLQPQGMMA